MSLHHPLGPDYQSHPFFDPLPKSPHPFFDNLPGADDFETLRLNTSTGRATSTAENIQANIAKLQAIQPRDEKQKVRLMGLIYSLQQQLGGGADRTSPGLIGGRAEEGPIEVSNEPTRGAAAGLANAVPGTADVLMAPADLAERKILGTHVVSRERKRIQSAEQDVREATDYRGTTGAMGEFAGQMVGSAYPFGEIAKGSAAAMRIAKLFAPARASEAILTRMAGSIGERLAGSSPLIASQIMAMDDATLKEKIKAGAILGGADVLSGIVGGVGRVPLKGEAPPVNITPEGATPEAPAVPEPGSDQAKLVEITQKIQAKKDAQAAALQLRKDAKTEWESKNPNKSWVKDLSKTERDKIIETFKLRQSAGPDNIVPPTGGTAQGGAEGGTAPLGQEAPAAGTEQQPTPQNVSPYRPQDLGEPAFPNMQEFMLTKKWFDQMDPGMRENLLGGIGSQAAKDAKFTSLNPVERAAIYKVMRSGKFPTEPPVKPGDVLPTDETGTPKVEGFRPAGYSMKDVERWFTNTSDMKSVGQMLGDTGVPMKHWDGLTPEEKGKVAQWYDQNFVNSPQVADWYENTSTSVERKQMYDETGIRPETHWTKLTHDEKVAMNGWYHDNIAGQNSDNFPRPMGAAGEAPPPTPAKGVTTQDFNDWWNGLHEGVKDDDLSHLGLNEEEISAYKGQQFDKLPEHVQRRLKDNFWAERTDKSTPMGSWWDGLSKDEQVNILNEMDPENPVPADEITGKLPIRSLSRQVVDHINNIYNNEVNVDNATRRYMGDKTVYEPSAAERAARAQFPEDLKNDLTNTLIDAHVQGLSEQDLQAALDRFAAEHEVSPEQMQAGLAALGHTTEGPTPQAIDPVEQQIRDRAKAIGVDPDAAVQTYQNEVADGRQISPEDAVKLSSLMRMADASNADRSLRDEAWTQVEALRAKYETPSATPEPSPATPDQTVLPPAQPAEPSPLTTPEAGAPGAGLPADLSQLTPEELDALKGKLLDKIDIVGPAQAEDLAALERLAAETQRRNPSVAKDTSPTKPSYSDAQIVQEQLNTPKEAPVERMDPKEVGQLARTSPRKLTDDQLNRLIEEVGYRIADLPTVESADWRNLMDKLLKEKTQRLPPPTQLNLPPSVIGAAAGFSYGYFTSDDEDKATNSLMWAAIGGIGASALVRLVESRRSVSFKANSPEMFPGQHQLPEIISYAAEREEAKVPLMERFRKYYAGLTRSTAQLEAQYTKYKGNNIPIYINAAKRASIFGRWPGKVEYAMTHGPVIEVNGEPVHLGAKGLVEIKTIAKDDIYNLDQLAAARTILEQMTENPNKKYPMDQVRATLTVQFAPAHIAQAADELRQFYLAGVKIAMDGGLIKSSNLPKFAQEEWYTALNRVFGDKTTQRDLKNIISSPQPIKGRVGGSSLMIKSPYESAVDMIKKVIRASEYNKIKQDYIAWVRSLPKEVGNNLLRRVENKSNAAIDVVYNDRIKAIRALMPEMTAEDAANLSVSMLEDITHESPHMTVYEDGVLRSYRLDDSAFQAFKSLMPNELEMFKNIIGKTARGATQMASRGVVFHPWFIHIQSTVIEPFQAALNSKYGFIPFIDNMRGWWSIVSNSPEYQKILAVGGVGSIQSLPYASPTGAIKTVEVGGKTPWERAVNNAKELRPIEAYKALAAPFGEAARMGEALRALDHGESTLEAAYAAWHLLGNTRMEGYMGAMRGFNQLTMFSRPAISAIDEMVTKMGVNPFRTPARSNSTTASVLRSLVGDHERVVSGAEFALKGFAFISIPSIALWYHNKDDEQITQLRQTASGSRYWFIRLPNNEIAKIRKPHIIGEMFGTTMEETLDAAYQKNPDGVMHSVEGMLNDAAFNVLPQFGVIPMSMLSNKQWGLGTTIVPEPLADTRLQGREKSGPTARIVSDGLAPWANKLDPQGFWTGALRRATTPAGFEFILNNAAGILGQDGLKALDMALSVREEGLPPAKAEWPVVGRFFAEYPSMNVRNVRDFYENATKTEEAANSAAVLAKDYPEFVGQYYESHPLEIGMNPAFATGRQQINNYVRSIREMQNLMEHKQMTPDEYRLYRDAALEMIIQLTGSINEMYKETKGFNQTHPSK